MRVLKYVCLMPDNDLTHGIGTTDGSTFNQNGIYIDESELDKFIEHSNEYNPNSKQYYGKDQSEHPVSYCVENDVLYVCQLSHVSQPNWSPSRALTLWTPASGQTPDEDGSLEYPYSFVYAMNVDSSKYYKYENSIYLAKADMPTCVWPPDTAGLWQWEKVT